MAYLPTRLFRLVCVCVCVNLLFGCKAGLATAVTFEAIVLAALHQKDICYEKFLLWKIDFGM